MKAYEAWHKYNKKDKMIVTEVEYPKYQTFPSVTICRNIISAYRIKNARDMLEYNSLLHNWLDYDFNEENATG